jgi:hypothetical protein
VDESPVPASSDVDEELEQFTRQSAANVVATRRMFRVILGSSSKEKRHV